MYFNNNENDSYGANFGYSMPEYNDFGYNGYPFEVTNGEPSTRAAQAGGYDLTGLSMTEIETWWLASGSGDDAGQYLGSTLLPSGSELAGAYGSHTGPISNSNSFSTDDHYDFEVLRQQPVYMPEYAGSSTAGPSAAPIHLPPAQMPFHPPVTFVGPSLTPSPVPTLSWPSPPQSASYLDAGNPTPGLYDQPLAAPDLRGEWPYRIPVRKGKTRATAKLPPTHPSPAGGAMWQHQQMYTPQDYSTGSIPQVDTGVPNTDLPAPVASSTGPQRSVRGAKGKGKQVDKGKVKRKRTSRAAPPPGFDWPTTTDRFCAEMAKIYFNQPTGEVITPETAYASATKFIKEDLYLSPLVTKPLGDRSCRELEQYLTGVLKELRPRAVGEKRGIRYTLERLADKLENELVAMNDDFALQEGPLNEVDPKELDASPKAVERRLKEQERRGAIREGLERMTLFFKIPGPGYLWSGPQTLFFAITYLMFGAGAFGDEGAFFTPKAPAVGDSSL